MEKHGVLSRVEMESRCEINYEIYIKTVNIEALTMVEMCHARFYLLSLDTGPTWHPRFIALKPLAAKRM